MTRLLLLILVWLSISHLGFAQDTIKAEPFDIGLPETPELIFTLQETYGPDSSAWPIWARKRISLSEMTLNKLDHLSLIINDSVPLRLNQEDKFVTRKTDTIGRSSYKALYSQENFTFAQVDSVIEFYSTIKPVPEGLRLSAIHKGKRIDLSYLTNIKDKLPQSYDWRDVIPTWATTFFEPEEQVFLSTVQLLLTSHEDYLTLLFFKDKLVYYYQSHYSGE